MGDTLFDRTPGDRLWPHDLAAGGAIIHDTYRYLLWRDLIESPDLPVTMLFVMLNPSTADGSTDDATLRRCLSYADREGATRLEIVNLYALRSRDPRQLRNAVDPVGPENVWYVEQAVAALGGECDMIVAAWGAHAGIVKPTPLGVLEIACILRDAAPLYCLGLTKHGQPRHPLMTTTGQELIRYEGLST